MFWSIATWRENYEPNFALYNWERNVWAMKRIKLRKKWNFLQLMWPNLQIPADLVTLTEEILNGKLHFLYSVNQNQPIQDQQPCNTETSQLNCIVNQLIGFYMTETLALTRLWKQQFHMKYLTNFKNGLN